MATIEQMYKNGVEMYPKTSPQAVINSDGDDLDDLLEGKVNEPTNEGTSGQVLTTDGSGGRLWATVQGSDPVTVVDDLTSTSTTSALSANQGRVLDGKLTELEQNVGNKADKVSVASSIPAGGLLPNTLYNLGTIATTTTISLATATDLTHLNEYMFRFSIGATVPTITLPTGVVYGKSRESVPPTLEANTGYEFSIVDGWALYESFDLS